MIKSGIIVDTSQPKNGNQKNSVVTAAKLVWGTHSDGPNVSALPTTVAPTQLDLDIRWKQAFGRVLVVSQD